MLIMHLLFQDALSIVNLNHKVLFGKDKFAWNDLDQPRFDMLTEVL